MIPGIDQKQQFEIEARIRFMQLDEVINKMEELKVLTNHNSSSILHEGEDMKGEYELASDTMG